MKNVVLTDALEAIVKTKLTKAMPSAHVPVAARDRTKVMEVKIPTRVVGVNIRIVRAKVRNQATAPSPAEAAVPPEAAIPLAVLTAVVRATRKMNAVVSQLPMP